MLRIWSLGFRVSDFYGSEFGAEGLGFLIFGLKELRVMVPETVLSRVGCFHTAL